MLFKCCSVYILANPACEEAPGCGEWTAPKAKNPKYKGKWRAPLIENPSYKVLQWSVHFLQPEWS